MATAVINGIPVSGSVEEIKQLIDMATATTTVGDSTQPRKQ